MLELKALSEKTTIEQIIVRRLNLKAGIADFESHSRETKPSGTVTCSSEKIFSFKKEITVRSKS